MHIDCLGSTWQLDPSFVSQLYHVYSANVGVTDSLQFREEGGLWHHVVFVFLGVRSSWVLASTYIRHPMPLFLPLLSK